MATYMHPHQRSFGNCVNIGPIASTTRNEMEVQMQEKSLPPVPQKLQEMLASYPELILRLQEVLVRSAERSRRVPLDPFEDAISALEGRLEKFAAEARKELKEAEDSGDDSIIRAAAAKESLMDNARYKRHWIGDDQLFKYFRDDFK